MITVIPKTLHFKIPAGTSRGIYTFRKVWYIKIQDGEQTGYGECAPLPHLSCDDVPDYEDILQRACLAWDHTSEIPIELLKNYPSILFGFESATRQLHYGSPRLWNTPFSRGEAGIPINGLIWMETKENMLNQIGKKIEVGFHCLKLKIGAINFEDELALIKFIRSRYSATDIELRIDANGAFKPNDALRKLKQLATFNIHSIEQPIRSGQWELMAQLCKSTPIPIALDEELISCNEETKKDELLHTICPQYIILKPSLHGGIIGVQNWIKKAESQHIGWWITSALESNIGLNAIAQFCATLHPSIPQGLGTGLLFTDNIDYPLEIRQDRLWYNPQKEKDIWKH